MNNIFSKDFYVKVMKCDHCSIDIYPAAMNDWDGNFYIKYLFHAVVCLNKTYSYAKLILRVKVIT